MRMPPAAIRQQSGRGLTTVPQIPKDLGSFGFLPSRLPELAPDFTFVFSSLLGCCGRENSFHHLGRCTALLNNDESEDFQKNKLCERGALGIGDSESLMCLCVSWYHRPIEYLLSERKMESDTVPAMPELFMLLCRSSVMGSTQTIISVVSFGSPVECANAGEVSNRALH